MENSQEYEDTAFSKTSFDEEQGISIDGTIESIEHEQTNIESLTQQKMNCDFDQQDGNFEAFQYNGADLSKEYLLAKLSFKNDEEE